MGEVYLARDTQLGRRAALKVVRPERLGSHRTIVDFLNEARLTAKFNHPNIITIHAVGQHGGWPYVALEYLDGHDLKDRLAERRLSLQEALRIAISITSALTEAHRHGVLHLDLKPANVFIPADGRVRVMDFGLAKTIQPTGPPLPKGSDAVVSATRQQAAAGEAWGTPNYTAPEQWMRRPPSAATDLWALGIMLFELCTNRVPYEQKVLVEKGRAICSSNPAPRVDEQANVPAELVQLIARCLEKDPGKRPTAEEAREILDDLLEHRHERLSIEESPFRGLLPYSHRHGGMFFGRESEIAAFVERLRLHPVLAVVGGPGVGKTSFIRAGVIPRLSEQEPWLVLSMRPGNRPFQALASRLRRPEAPIGPAPGPAPSGAGSLPELVGSHSGRGRLSDRRSMPSQPGTSDPPKPKPRNLPPQPLSAGADPTELDDIAQLAAELFASPGRLSLLLRGLAEDFGCKVLLVVHNIEELFLSAQGRGEISADEQRGRFLRAVCTACRDAGDPLRVVLSGRDEILGRLASFRVVRPALTQVMVLEPLGPDALERMLRRQVTSVGYRFEDEDMARDMAVAVGRATNGLPLLQFTAQQLWERRDTDRHLLLRSSYEAMGGVEGAVAKHADGVLDALSKDERELARKLLLRLVTPDRQRKVVSRARALQGVGDLSAEEGGPSSAQEVLSRLTQARLVSVMKRRGATEDEATVTLAHDALIHTWSTLSRWIDASKEGLARLAELEEIAELWEQQSRNPAHLLAADPLRDAKRLLATITIDPPDGVVALVAESASRQRRRLRRRRLAIGGAIGLSLLVASAASLAAWVIADKEREAVTQRDRARDQRAEALRESARAALGQHRVLEARAKLRVALTEKDSAAARALWWRLGAEPMVWRKDLGALVYQVSFSPDGRTIATACMDGSIYLFDVDTHAQRVLRGHVDQVAAVAFSPDGRRLVSGSYDHSLRTWDVATGQQERLFEGHSGKVWAVAFSPDGELVVSGSSDREVRLWRAATGELVHQLVGHGSEVYALSFSPDGKVVASGSNDKTVRLWDVDSGASRQVLEGHAGGVEEVAFDGRGERIAAASLGGEIRLWDAGGGKLERVLEGHSGGVRSVSFSADGRVLASGSYDSTIRLWDVATGEQRRQIDAHSAGVRSVSFSPDGSLLASGSYDRTVRLWRLAALRTGSPFEGHTSAVLGVSPSPDGKTVASASYDGTLRLWDVASGAESRVLTGHAGGVAGVSFSPGGDLLASVSLGGEVRLWDVTTGTEARRLVGHTGAVYSQSFSPDGKLLATSSRDRTARLWDVATGGQLRIFQGHGNTVWDVAFSPDGQTLATGSVDRTVRLWDVETGKVTQVLEGHGGGVRGVAYSPDGTRLASGGTDRTIRLWDVEDGSSRVIGEHPGRVYWMAFHPDGRRLGAGCSDGTARIWDLDTGNTLTLAGHHNEVNSLRFGPSGKIAYTASDDGTVRSWHVDTGLPYWHAPVLGLTDPPRLYSHQGWRVLTGGGERTGSTGPGQQAPPEGGWRTAIEERSRWASSASARPGESGEVLCVHTTQDELEMWHLGRDEPLGPPRSIQGLRQVLAVPGGCVARDKTSVSLYRAGQPPQPLSVPGLTQGVSYSTGQILVVAERDVRAFSPAGDAVADYPVGVGARVVALSPVPGRPESNWLVVGYRDGNIELVPTSADMKRPTFSFEQVPASPPMTILVGPMHTLIVGYANGLLGMWNQLDGSRLAFARLHGPVVHTRIVADKLYAATSLGRSMVWDLSVFHNERCDLLREVWQEVPVVWEQGQPVAASPPDGHRCSRPGSGAPAE